MKEINVDVETAIARVQELGKDGNEHLVCFGPDGTLRFEKTSGKENAVDFEEEGKQGLCKEGDIFVHNHPINIGLSFQDLSLATKFDGTIYAVAKDGSRYWSQGFGKDMPLAIVRVIGAIAQTAVRAEMATLEGVIEEDALQCLFCHFMCVYSKALGLLKSYDFKLEAETQALVDKAMPVLVENKCKLEELL